MKCWCCGANLPDPEYGKILFRAECDKCGAALHSCRNCKYYHLGKPNDCDVPGTDFIPDRTKANLCEEFKLSKPGDQAVKPSVEEVENKLFSDGSVGDFPKPGPHDRFNSLFKKD